MAGTQRRIAVLTSGGDAPGLNAVIRSVVKTAVLQHGWEVLGVLDGFEGLIGEPRLRPLSLGDVSGMLPRGGSILGCSNRGHLRLGEGSGERTPSTEAAFDEVVAAVARSRIEALVVVGGDGSHRIAHELVRRGVSVVGVPKTIDNDLAGTDSSFGFDSAVSFATEAIDRLHTTAASHGRVMVVEVMGRDAGWIALYAGIAGGADVILLPEIPFVLAHAAAHIAARASAGKRFSIVVAAEGARALEGVGGVPGAPGGRKSGIAQTLIVELERLTGGEARAVVLGHLQRGGSPTAADRLLASAYGAAAVRAIAEGRFGQMVAWRCGRMELVPIGTGGGQPRLVPLDHPLIETARGLGISFASAGE
jgi:ATP-dependent phosphofructokinase / diphosphate-dependent phosphofructokinase